MVRNSIVRKRSQFGDKDEVLNFSYKEFEMLVRYAYEYLAGRRTEL